MPNLSISPVEDIRELSKFFNNQPSEHLKYFTPFKFDVFSLLDELFSNERNVYRVILFDSNIVSFFMLRWQKEFTLASHGVLTDYKFQNRGLGNLGLMYCKNYCSLNNLPTEFVCHVDSENKSSFHLAQKYGNKLL